MKRQKGFTLIELLLVIAIIAILATIVIIAINPAKQLADARNAQRRAEVNTLINAVYQYMIDTGNVPATITTTETPICKSGAASCTGLADLSVLTANEKYIVSIPFDPTGSTATSAGYTVTKTANNRVTVKAPAAEQGATIQVTR